MFWKKKIPDRIIKKELKDDVDKQLIGLPGVEEYSYEEFSKDCDRWNI